MQVVKSLCAYANAWGYKMAVVGVNDRSINENLLVFIQATDGETVCAALGEGATRDLTAQWVSPFEQDTAASGFEKAGGIIQTAGQEFGYGVTSKTTFNSTQVWNGNLPHSFNLPVVFYAIRDAYTEVQLALIALEKMASPELSAMTPGGRAPGLVSIKVGKMIIYPECHIEHISIPIAGPKSKNGYLLKAEVTLSITTKVTLNASHIQSTFS